MDPLPDFPITELEIRTIALDLAHNPSESPEKVIARAEAYVDFLTAPVFEGEEAQGPTDGVVVAFKPERRK